MRLTKLIEDAKASGLRVAQSSERYQYPCTISDGRRRGVIIYEDGTIHRLGVQLDLCKRMTVQDTHHFLELDKKKKPPAVSSPYHQHQFFEPLDKQEHERGNSGHPVYDACANCGRGFMEHYNGKCPKR